MAKKKLAIITSHPIQYNAPLFQLLNSRNNIQVRVFYTWGKTALENKFDPGFGKVIQWDIPLLEGYEYEFLENKSVDKGSHHFKGIVNPDIIRRIDSFEPDSILVFGWSFQSHLKVMRHYKKKKPVLFRGDSTILNKSSFLKEQIRSLFLKWVYRHVDYALYVGRNNFEYYKKAGMRDAQLIYAGHAIDNGRFSEQSDSKERQALSLRETMNIKPDELVFLYAGKLEEVKHVSFLLGAFVKSGLQGKAHLVIVGNGILEKGLKSEYQTAHNIHFMGFQNQGMMPVIYRVGDVFILPSKSETWGLSVNEAMACSRPVIVSDHCGCAPDLVLNGQNGYIFRSGDQNDLVEKLLLAGTDKAHLKTMGETSLELIHNFSFENICKAVENIVTAH